MSQDLRPLGSEPLKNSTALPRSEDARVIGRQMLRSGTSIGANYRTACHPRSDADFIAKLGIVIEECDETRVLA